MIIHFFENIFSWAQKSFRERIYVFFFKKQTSKFNFLIFSKNNTFCCQEILRFGSHLPVIADEFGRLKFKIFLCLPQIHYIIFQINFIISMELLKLGSKGKFTIFLCLPQIQYSIFKMYFIISLQTSVSCRVVACIDN